MRVQESDSGPSSPSRPSALKTGQTSIPPAASPGSDSPLDRVAKRKSLGGTRSSLGATFGVKDEGEGYRSSSFQAVPYLTFHLGSHTGNAQREVSLSWGEGTGPSTQQRGTPAADQVRPRSPPPLDPLTERKIQVLCNEAAQCIRRQKYELAEDTLTLALQYRSDAYKARGCAFVRTRAVDVRLTAMAPRSFAGHAHAVLCLCPPRELRGGS